MKKYLFTFFSLIMFISLKTFSQSIPNGSFENWTFETHYEEPDTFVSTNSQSYICTGIANVTKTTDSHTGNYAVKLETIECNDETIFGGLFIGTPGDGGLIGGVPYTERPDSLKGYVKYGLEVNDTAYIFLLFKINGIPLGVAMQAFYGTQSNYSEFTLPITWLAPYIQPDTLAAVIVSSNLDFLQYAGSYIYVDALELTGVSTLFPNGDFENWSDISSDEPDEWLTSNFWTNFTDLAVTKTTDSYDGNYALRLENVETMWNDVFGAITNGGFGDDGPFGGMPVSQNPDILSGYYKYFPEGPDTALASITLFWYDSSMDSTIMLEEQVLKLPAVSSYTYFEVPVQYNFLPIADTVNLAFASGNIEEDSAYVGLGSVLYLDALELTFKPVSVYENNFFGQEILIHPNPAKDVIYIKLTGSFNDEIKFQLFDVYGKSVIEEFLKANNTNNFKLDLSNLSEGIYFYNINSGFFKNKGKIIISQ
ncbi:MAG: T9SS type A sorting domain-containing protein [Bacteroidales bacterium]|nr:T9SS type A sorting domain-containing protein [Bacteroidales bacterium]